MDQAVAQGTVVVFQDRYWFGDHRLGAFVLSVDGRRIGVARVQGSLAVSVQPGHHALRTRS